MREVDKINLNPINKTKNAELGMLMLVNKSFTKDRFKLLINVRMIKFFMEEQVQINGTAMTKSKRQSSSAYEGKRFQCRQSHQTLQYGKSPGFNCLSM